MQYILPPPVIKSPGKKWDLSILVPEEHFKKYLDFNADNLYFRMQIIMNCSLFDILIHLLILKGEPLCGCFCQATLQLAISVEIQLS